MDILNHPDHTAYVQSLKAKGHKVEATVNGKGNRINYLVHDADGTTWRNVWVYKPTDFPAAED